MFSATAEAHAGSVFTALRRAVARSDRDRACKHGCRNSFRRNSDGEKRCYRVCICCGRTCGSKGVRGNRKKNFKIEQIPPDQPSGGIRFFGSVFQASDGDDIYLDYEFCNAFPTIGEKIFRRLAVFGYDDWRKYIYENRKSVLYKMRICDIIISLNEFGG